jgi:hypothetical protein
MQAQERRCRKRELTKTQMLALCTHMTDTPSSKHGGARRQWLMPVILATLEAEIRWMVAKNQPRQIVCETLSRKYPLQKGLVE